MGVDALFREGTVCIHWFNKLLRLSAAGGGSATVTQVDAEREGLIGTAGRYNLLLAPSRAEN